MSVSTRRGSAGGVSLSSATVAAIRAGAAEDAKSVTGLIQQLVRVPSRAGLDDYEPIIDLIDGWLREHGLAPRQLNSPTGDLLGLACDVPGHHPGPATSSTPASTPRRWATKPPGGIRRWQA
jgi:succinyl-diaminopimelate desuccinylase